MLCHQVLLDIFRAGLPTKATMMLTRNSTVRVFAQDILDHGYIIRAKAQGGRPLPTIRSLGSLAYRLARRRIRLFPLTGIGNC